MKRAILVILLTLASLAVLAAAEPWQDDAARADRYYGQEDFDAAWLFYERAIAQGCDDGTVWYKAARSYRLQDLEADPERQLTLYTVARYYLSEQSPGHRFIEYAGEYADPDADVNRAYLRRAFRSFGAKLPRGDRGLAGIRSAVGGFFADRFALLGDFWRVLRQEGLKDGFAWAKDHAWDLLFSWLTLSLLTGIILPVVMAVTLAREGLKSYIAAYAFLIHWGPLGIHRFYLGRPVSGVVWLCTGGLLGFGLFFDIFLTGAYVRAWNAGHRPPGRGGRASRGPSYTSASQGATRASRPARPARPAKPPKAPKPPKAAKPPKPAKAKKPPKPSRAEAKASAAASSDGSFSAGSDDAFQEASAGSTDFDDGLTDNLDALLTDDDFELGDLAEE